KISTEKMIQKLEQKDIKFQKSDLFENVFKIKDTQKLIHSGFLGDGLCSVQDDSAHIPVELLDIQNGNTVLDMCAAPGGKFIQILQKEKSITAIAVDADKSRLKRVKENLNRLNLTHGFLVVADARQLPFKPIFDKILLDAPCSGLGVIRKHPDIKWRRNEAEIQSFIKIQTDLIKQAGMHLMKDGKLIYSTCSIDIDEDENITNAFIENNSNHFKQIAPPEFYKHFQKKGHIRTFPDEKSMDGSYCAIIKKF
ncbi:MAG: RsmB/NOP family class I SAM-dependent RNA methyltransferase, partial [Calditrichaceae bacterium]